MRGEPLGRRLFPWLAPLARALLRLTFRVRVHGREHAEAAGAPVLVVANHVSYLDALLLALFLPGPLTFAIDPRVARQWWVRPFLAFVRVVPVDPARPLAARRLVEALGEGARVALFPEGRRTETGSLMKIYPGPAFVADRAGAPILPVRIAGAERSAFSRLGGRVRRRLFPRVTLTIRPARRLALPVEVRGAARRAEATRRLAALMADLMFETSDWRRTVAGAVLEARRRHGSRHRIVEDTDRRPLDYDALLTRAVILAGRLARRTAPGERVGVALPPSVGAVLTFLALGLAGRVPAMLNVTAGPAGLEAACRLAGVRLVCTSRRFVAAVRLGREIEALGRHARVLYLEDLRTEATPIARLGGWLRARALAAGLARPPGRPDDPAVILFTSGTEGTPKGVALSHANLLANAAQILARIDAAPSDRVLNTLPLFHAFGLGVGTVLPLTAGLPVFLYPSPLHYRIIPEIAYDIGATVMFGTNTFLAAYARHAHPYDFFRMRYVFAGAEPLEEATRRLWADRFGVRILEGYGTTETAPVLAADSPMDPRPGTVGRFLPGIEYVLEPVPGLAAGGVLSVRGPNVMLGYLRGDGAVVPPRTRLGPGWYDTGDIVSVDAEGIVRVVGRARRFAKVGGESVSLAAVEALAAALWPGERHAALAVRDPRKGERIVLVTERAQARRQDLAREAARRGLPEPHVPAEVVPVREIPRLALGKTDYGAARRLLDRLGEARGA